MFIHFLKISNFFLKEFKKISLEKIYEHNTLSALNIYPFDSISRSLFVTCIMINCILLIFSKPNHYFKFHTSTSYNTKQRGTIIGILSYQLICIFQTYINYSLIATLSAWIRLRLDSSSVVNQLNI